MDVSASVITFSLILIIGYTSGAPQMETTSVPDVTTTPTEVPPKLCVTARGMSGNCIDRQYCDYSTYAIDLSLYAPKGYMKTCSEKEVCCPTNYQLAQETTNKSYDENFDFDEDD